LSPVLLEGVRGLNYTEPTPIQRLAIPPALAGDDVLASAPTGSGKSAAFGLPALEICLKRPLGTTAVLILAPTRELAQQITAHLTQLAAHTKIRIASVHGGVAMKPQIAACRRGTEIIVATPGRLLDLINQGVTNFEGIELLVLDEADRMLDMGFLPDVKRVLRHMPEARQTLFFSATVAGQAERLATELLNNPVRVDLNPQAIVPVEKIAQTVFAIDQHLKTELLVDLLKNNTIYNAIVFTRTKARADRVADALLRHNVETERIHGDRSQAQRNRALASFKRGKYRILVATDIAARGIDIDELGHVINYDVPSQPEDYVHRIGRTARANRSGEAITFVSREEASLFAQIERAMGTRVSRSEHRLTDVGAAFFLEAAPAVGRRSFRRRRR
jgi:ATP-dependent RNA helicase RhlE